MSGIEQKIHLETLDGEKGISEKDVKILDETLGQINTIKEKNKFYQNILEGFRSEETNMEDKKI